MLNGKWKMENVERSEIRHWQCRWKNLSRTCFGMEVGISDLFIPSIKYLFKGMNLLIIIILSLIECSFAQSVDSLINEAIHNNPYLRSLEQKIFAVEFRAESVDNLPPPTLGIEFTQVPIDEINIWDDAISNSLSLSQMFPLGGKLSAITEVERKNVEVVKDDYETYKANLTAQIKMTYYNLWQLDRRIEVQQKTIDLLNDLLKSIEISYQVNRIEQSDVLSIQSEVASNKAQLVIFKNQCDAEIYKLNKLLGRDLESKEIVVNKEISIDTLKYSQPELEKILIDSNPSLKKMNSMIEMNRAMITANNKELIPDLMVQGMLMRMPRGMILTEQSDIHMVGTEPAKTEYMYSLMASITLPFMPWSSGKYDSKEEELAAGIKGIEYERTNMQREMFSNLKASFVKLKTANELVALYEKEIIPSYEQAAASQVSGYQNNRSNITTVIDSYRMLLMQKMNYYMVQADRQMAIAEIEMMVGRKMDEF